MRSPKSNSVRFLATTVILVFILSFPPSASSQSYPIKPITIYCGYEAGGTVDVTTRALAQAAENVLGQPVVVENKPGGASTVAASLLAVKKPDGYTLGAIAGGALLMRPHLMKLPYNPLEDFSYIMEYSRLLGNLCVLSDSPFKTIDELIVHAKAHPGLAYASPGMYTQNHLSIELLAKCKGLKFKHVPFKGSTPAVTALMGKHTDFIATAGNVPYVKQGVLRMLLNYNYEKRLSDFPNVPTLRELGCEDLPGMGIFIIGPKGLPSTIWEKLGKTFKQVAETPSFKELLAKFDMPYEYYGYKDVKQMEQDIFPKYEWFKTFLKDMGAKRED